MELSIIISIINTANKEDVDHFIYTFDFSAFSENSTLQFLNTLKSILKKNIEITDKNRNVDLMPWFTWVKIKSIEKSFSYRLDPEFKKHLLNFKKYFAKYNFKHLLKLRSEYSIRIYKMLKDLDSLDESVYFDINDLHKLLKTPDSMKYGYTNFKKLALDKVVLELRVNTDIDIIIEEVRELRKIKGIKFVFIKNRIEI